MRRSLARLSFLALVIYAAPAAAEELKAKVRATAHDPGEVPQRADARARDDQVVVRVGEPAPGVRKPSVELLNGK